MYIYLLVIYKTKKYFLINFTNLFDDIARSLYLLVLAITLSRYTKHNLAISYRNKEEGETEGEWRGD